MATVMPNIIGLILAKRLDVNPSKREVSLVGLHAKLTLPRFPDKVGDHTVFAMLNGGRGEGALQRAVCSVRTPDEWIYRNRRWVRFPDDPLMASTIEIRVKELVFAEPGEYLYVLSFDGKPITDRRISVQAKV
ncbi:MAG: hypothetical protein HY289_15325 [Planctomycetes bacterium]|nr:hypothetical protein [Planctomycetota bacterium]